MERTASAQALLSRDQACTDAQSKTIASEYRGLEGQEENDRKKDEREEFRPRVVSVEKALSFYIEVCYHRLYDPSAFQGIGTVRDLPCKTEIVRKMTSPHSFLLKIEESKGSHRRKGLNLPIEDV